MVEHGSHKSVCGGSSPFPANMDSGLIRKLLEADEMRNRNISLQLRQREQTYIVWVNRRMDTGEWITEKPHYFRNEGQARDYMESRYQMSMEI